MKPTKPVKIILQEDENEIFSGVVKAIDVGVVVGSLEYKYLSDGTVHLFGLWVKKEYEGKGIAKRLNIKIFKKLSEYDKHFILTAVSWNNKVNTMLEHFGFTSVRVAHTKLYVKEMECSY